uniref:Secreted protein n=1 Tax=Trichogramma kaykai TaxID=54128 RepID=A0ABD2WSH0_9HYME
MKSKKTLARNRIKCGFVAFLPTTTVPTQATGSIFLRFFISFVSHSYSSRNSSRTSSSTRLSQQTTSCTAQIYLVESPSRRSATWPSSTYRCRGVRRHQGPRGRYRASTREKPSDVLQAREMNY